MLQQKYKLLQKIYLSQVNLNTFSKFNCHLLQLILSSHQLRIQLLNSFHKKQLKQYFHIQKGKVFLLKSIKELQYYFQTQQYFIFYFLYH
ncbi:hypothetical protein IMG5_103240 [Ichthyophthirius multifiliis]|uniref:Uncharacterized protein n=1 Tax=Ichthyophthirius multifiliis TaxID=5932 RepID=G0QSS8_ICHMU|nr:hypothetical protein IMG5_103240 [Ichthyophthirius multifiliis]EGR31723.1 hypothetical protein IMG5_103240 [Ichthyophthirius multifiliis]|eukprot:XP_004035209.1 hypothetical protein IMG5_103240 [Ichthyophthirius multifiliis]